MSLTIFQKMLIAPAAGMALYCGYLYVAYGEYRQATAAIESIRDDYLPASELAGDNTLLFESLVTQMKDAVLAGEVSWLANSQRSRDQIIDNLSKMERYKNAVPAEEIKRMRENFNLYYQNAEALSLAMLGQQANAEQHNTLVENVERYHGVVSGLIKDNKRMIHERVRETVQLTTRRLDDLLMAGVYLGVFLILVVAVLTFGLSLATRKSLKDITGKMKDMAQGHPDFSKRLALRGNDELGTLANWFNQLSDKLEQDYKKIELLSITDRLTQLYNRTKIDQLFADELRRSERYDEVFSVILIDLDHFKSVNDNYGHQTGDTVLQELAGLLKENVRETDYVGRWGGEEFIVISPRTEMASAMLVAEKLRKSIAEYSFSEVGHKTASFGVASYRAGDDEDSMTQRVDKFLYMAKNQGRNRVVGEAENGRSDSAIG